MASDVPKDRLEVKILEARRLQPPRGTGGSVNPFTRVECADDFQSTGVKSGDTDPKWNSEIMVFDSITAREVEFLLITVRHKDVLTYQDKDLGIVALNLATALQSPGINITEWYPLSKSTKMDYDAMGEIKISITYFLDELSDLGFDDDFDDDEDLSSTQPNAVKVTVEGAKQLRAPGSAKLCDAYVVLQCGKGPEKSCKPVRKNNYPKFGFEATFYNKDVESFLYITVRHKTTISSTFIGQARVSMVEIAGAGEMLQKWVPLLDQKWGFEAKDLGEVQITARWEFDKKVRDKRRLAVFSKRREERRKEKQRKALEAQLQEIQKEEDNAQAMKAHSDEEDEAYMDDEERKAFEDEAEANAMAARAAQIEMEERLSQIKPGDYQLQVHVIEGRDLKGENLNGTSDPVVYVECMGKKQHTKIVKNVTNCLFGDRLYFTFKDMTKEQISEAVITIACYDANTILRNTLIGTYSLDFVNVYLQNDHEFYRQWVAVVDNISKNDKGIQGLIKLSISILGPGDRQKVHDLNEEIQKELKGEAESGGLGGMMVTGPDIKQELQFLVVTILKAEDLPNYSSFGSQSIKASVRVDFAGNPKTMTKYKSCSAARGESLILNFNQEIHLPVFYPTQANRITVTLWQKDTLSSAELVSSVYYEYDKVQPAEKKKKRGFGGLFSKSGYLGEPPKWGILYGAPTSTSQSKDSSRLMNKFPDLASHYRGRLLLGMYVEKNPSSSRGNVTKRKNISYELPNELYPKTARFVLRATIIQGSEIPIFKFPNKQGAAKMKVILSMGREQMETEFKSNRKGMVEWNTPLEMQLDLPVDSLQMPDIFLYLVKGPDLSSKTVSFVRLKAHHLLPDKFESGPKWFALESDPTKFGMFGLSEDSYPGSLLVQLGFGWQEHARETRWPDYTLDLENKKPYGLRVNIFQCRNLPSSDENGQLDPYVKVRFCGRKQKTKCMSCTLDPCFYQVLEFAETLPEKKFLMPEVILQIWDRDRLGHNSQVAGMRLAMTEVSFTRSCGSRAPVPEWHQLKDTNGKEGVGEMLVSVQLIMKKGMHEKFPIAASLVPKTRQAYIEIIALGVRDLQPLGFSGIGATYVEFEINSDGERYTATTRKSKSPNSSNPNYAERFIKAVRLPDEFLFCPQLTIRVFESKLGVRKLVGVAALDITNKLPWNDEGYEAPQQQAFRVQEINIDDTQSMKEGEGDESSDDDDDGKKKKKKKKKKDDGVEETKGDSDEDSEEGEEKGDTPDGSDASSEEGDVVGFDEIPDSGVGIFPTKDQLEKIDFADLEEGIEKSLRKDLTEREEEEEEATGIRWFDKAEQAFSLETKEVMLSDLDIKFPEGWSTSEFNVGRDWLLKEKGNRLEDYLQTKPFENYPLFRGSSRTDRGILYDKKPSRRQVGLFKGLIVVSETPPPANPNSQFITMGDLTLQKKYIVRLYVIKAMHLQPKDRNGLSDPYLQIKIGKDKIKDKKQSLKKKTLDPDFYRSYEIPVNIPGDSQLKIQVFDWDRFSIDDLIGETIIDLEDRWFSKKWQWVGGPEWYDSKSKDLADAEEVKSRIDTFGTLKPIEVRDLYSASSTNPQGQVQLWVDIIPDTLARSIEPELVEPPPPMMVEVRVICWQSRDVVSMEYSGLNDLFAKFWITGDAKKKKNTDTHWRAKGGKGSWNYRLKFDVELPLKNPEGGRLMFQLWDKDIVKYNDVIAESSVELYQWFQLCYQRKDSVKPFKEIADAEKRLEEKRKQELLGVAPPPPVEEPKKKKKKDESKVELTDEEIAMMEEMGEDEDEDGEEGDEDDITKPLLADEKDEEEIEKEKKKKEEERKKQLADEESKAALNKIKELLGIGDIAEDAKWITMQLKNFETGEFEKRGETAISIEILPKDIADSQPVGHGRNQPNDNPYLPPPAGRLQFSINPFKMLFDLLGPKVCYQFVCVLVCVIAIVAFALIGQYYTTISTIASQV